MEQERGKKKPRNGEEIDVDVNDDFVFVACIFCR